MSIVSNRVGIHHVHLTSESAGLTCEKSLPCVRQTAPQTLWDCVCGHLLRWSLPVSSASSSPPLAHCASVDVASVSWLLRPSCPQRGQETVLNGLLNGTLLEKMVMGVNCNNLTIIIKKISDGRYEGLDVNSHPTSLRLDCAVDTESS